MAVKLSSDLDLNPEAYKIMHQFKAALLKVM